MKKELFKTAVLIILLFSIAGAASATDHHLTTDTTWSGTVNFTGNIIVDNGVTLTIHPGSQVNMAPGMGIVVNGRLLAVGTASDSIRFTAITPASGWDGIIFNWTPSSNDTSKMIYCVLSYGKTTNTAYHSSEGGVLFLSHINKFLITNCRFHHNHADDVAGAVFMTNCGGALRNNIFAYNSSDGAGGIYLTSSTTVITDNLFYHNSAGFYGGGMIISACSPYLTNCTFSGNTAGLSGGAAMMDSQASVTFTNCIFHNDTGSPGNEISIDNTASTSGFYYCLVEGGLSGIDGSGKVGAYQNNMDTDPLFTGSGAHPCSLSASSPCINQGKPDMTGLDVPPDDLAGNPRVVDACGNRIDMGAYEYERVSGISVSGIISDNSFWCADTVNVTGNLMIANGITLGIGPGVLVYFRGNYGITVEGAILAEGTSTGNVIFKPQNTAQGWSGIVFSGVDNANDTSRFSFCQLLNGIALNRGGGNNGGAIYIDNYNKVRISNCIFHQNYASNEGGAIYLHSANLKVAGCSFSDNQGLIAGGAISAHNSTLNLTDNHFSYNFATGAACASPTPSRGGAIYLNTCTLNSTQNKIEHNNTSCQGGGIYATSSTMTMTNDTLSYNSAEDYTNSGSGGGLFCSTSALTATGNLIANNTGTWGGGAFLGGVSGEIKSNTFSQNLAYVSGITPSQGGGIVFASSSNPVFRNNVVKNNSATYSGGIDINGSNPQIIQNLVIGNQATTGGGGIGFSNASPLLLNNTICNNVGENWGGGLWFSSTSAADVRNNIIYGNSSVNGGGYQVYLNNNSCNPNFYFCDIQGGRTGFGGSFTNYTGVYEHNIDDDPLFVNSGESLYPIESASPCLNMGDPATTTAQAGDHDLAGNPRIRNGRIDIGAYETARGTQPCAGNAILFSGENDSIVIDNPYNFIFGNTFTVEFWLKAGSMSTGYHTILKKGTEWEIRLFYDDALSIIEFGINDNSVFSYYQTTGTFLLNHWNHIAAVFNLSSPGPYVAVYVNGVKGMTDVAEAFTFTSAPVTIGAGIIGQMDELRVWQTARTTEDIRTGMHLMIPPESSGLMTYHQFNGYVDSTVVDISGGNNGTLMNMNLPGCLVGSTVPAAGGVSHQKIISATGNADFTGTDLSMDIKSIASTDTVVVSRLDTLPNLNPPGANTVEPQYWITEVYGGGNLTADLTFHVLQDITFNDEILLNLNRLYSRSHNSDSLWTFVSNATYALSAGNTVTFNNIAHTGQFCVPHRVVPDNFAGKALEFNGVNQYVKIDPLYQESPEAITAETWFYPTAPAPGNDMILYNGEHGEFYLMYHQYTFTFAVKLNNQSWYSVAGPAPALREWYHVCGVWQNNGSLKIYVNGIPWQTASIPALNLYDPGSSYLASLGCYNRNAGFVAGKADEMRVWSVARTTQEIREMMHLTIPDGTTGLLGYWQFNENSGSETKDHGGNHDGILVNMSDTCRVQSSIPAGGGNSYTKIIDAPGTEEFAGTGVRMNFMEKSGTDTIVVTHIDTSANVNPVADTIYAAEYWVIHQYGNGTLNANIRFDVGGDVTHSDEEHPARITLLSRPYNSEDEWVFNRVADSAWRTGDRIQFGGINSLSQFSIGKGIHPVIGISPDSVRFSRTPSTVIITDSILISNNGTDTLIISGISHTSPQFTLSATQMVILSGEERFLVVSYHPASDGWVHDTLKITSNDPDNPVVNVTVRGQGFVIDTWPGSALLYEGTSKYVEVADNSTLDLTGNYTLEAWISPEGFGFLGGIISKYQQSGANGYYLRLTGASPYTGLNFDGLSTAQDILEPGKWFHIAAVNSNGTRTLYVNGIPLELNGTADIIEANNNPLTIGVDYLASPRYFNGKIDEVRIWNVARSLQEVRENMHLTLKGNETRLVSYWQFNEGDGASAADKIHGNNGVLHDFLTSGWVESTIPAGGGTSFTNEITGTGSFAFTGTGIDMNFTEKTGNDQIVATRIDSLPYLSPSGRNWPLNNQYWAVDKYGNGTFAANLTFLTREDLTSGDEINPASITLYTRKSVTDTNWVYLTSATAVNSSTNQATFTGIQAFGQFLVCRNFPPSDNFPGTTIEFDGNNDNITGTGIDTNLSAVTIEAWIYHNSLPGEVQRYVTVGPETAVLRFDGTSYGGYHELHFYIKKTNGSICSLSAANVLSTGEWIHVAGTYDGTTMKLYLNGKLIQSATPGGGLFPPDGTFRFSSNSECMDGKIDEIRIWNYARSEEEIRENMCLVVSAAEPGLKNYWQLNENSGTTVLDFAGGLTGNFENMAENNWVGSTIPFGSGASNSQIVSSTGTLAFPLTGMVMNFTSKTGIDSIVVTRIDTTANINPAGVHKVFDSQYWVVNNYGTGIFNADLTFTLSEELTSQDEIHPSLFKLYTRGNTADTTWGLLNSATAVNATTNQVTFEEISGFGQFIIGKNLQVPENLAVTNTTVHIGESECFNALQTISVTDLVVETGAEVTMIAGMTIHFHPGIMVLYGGKMHGYITSNSEYCTGQSPGVAATVMHVSHTPVKTDISGYKIYPNPTSGRFILELTDEDSMEEVRVAIFGMHGEKVLQTTAYNKKGGIFSIEKAPAGIYIIRISNGKETVTGKIVKI